MSVRFKNGRGEKNRFKTFVYSELREPLACRRSKNVKVARLQSEFCTKDVFRATNFLTKNAPKLSPKILEPLFCGSEKNPRENSLQIFPLNFPNFPAKNQNKFTDELLQERREEKTLACRGWRVGVCVSALLSPRHHSIQNPYSQQDSAKVSSLLSRQVKCVFLGRQGCRTKVSQKVLRFIDTEIARKTTRNVPNKC